MPPPTGTLYPTSSDTGSSIGTAVNSGDVILASFTDTATSAILAVESALGISSQWAGYATVYDWIAAMALQTQVQYLALTYSADTGSANTYVATLSPVPASYSAGLNVTFKAANANTGASTLNVNSLGAKSLVKNGSQAVAAGDISAGQIITSVYDGTNFQITGGGGGGLSSALVAGGMTNGNASSAPIGTPVYQTSTSGQFNLAKADAFGTCRAIALVFDTSIASSAAGKVQMGGLFTFASTAQVDAVCGTSGGFGTPGQVFYLSDATAGTLTSAAPSTAGHFLVAVLQAVTTTTAYMLLPAQIIGL